MAVTMADITKLRKMSGAGMMDCKKALTESDGDIEKAMEIIRKKGQAIAAKRSDREAAEGCVLAKKDEIFILSHEVRFALQSDDSGELAILLSQHTTLGSLTIRTFSGDSLSFFTDNFHCLIEIAFCIVQCILAIHHTSTSHFTELGYISHTYSHNIFLF